MTAGPRTFEAPGLPALTWDEYAWVTRDTLASWSGFQSRGGPYGSRDRLDPSTGLVTVAFRAHGKGAPPHPAQLAAYQHLKDHEVAVHAAILDATFRVYPKLRAEWLVDEPAAASRLPVLGSPAELREVMGLHQVHVLALVRDGLALVGFEIGCNWDGEHGFGVLTHGERVIHTGPAEDAFSPPIAARAGTVHLDRG